MNGGWLDKTLRYGGTFVSACAQRALQQSRVCTDAWDEPAVKGIDLALFSFACSDTNAPML